MALRDRNFSDRKPDRYWRASRIAARILLKARHGKRLSPRDRRIGRLLVDDPGLEDRLIDQGISHVSAPHKTHV
jgi:hypothetical protein